MQRNGKQRQWNTIIFSDESKFDLEIGDVRSKILRKPTEAYHRDCLKRTVKFPASVMIWGCMSANGVGRLCFIENTVNAAKYISILEENLLPSIESLSSFGDYIFQQDGAPAYIAKLMKKWLSENQIKCFRVALIQSSPDHNPIESVCAIMKRRPRSDPQRTISDLKKKS